MQGGHCLPGINSPGVDREIFTKKYPKKFSGGQRKETITFVLRKGRKGGAGLSDEAVVKKICRQRGKEQSVQKHAVTSWVI